jgi:GR25 family glycosyltransferase involved in LPS biosynthesis
MEKLNCRIINVNPETPQEFINFGHSVDENGNKIRYSLRRERINRFLEKDINLYDISIFDAVTPHDFDVQGNNVIIGEKSFITGTDSLFYVANALSHASIWSLDEDTLVLEDDVIFDESKFEILRNILIEFKSLAGKNEILYLQMSIPYCEGAPDKTICYVQPISDNIYLGDMDVAGTAAYFITKETKKTVMDLINSGFPLLPCDQMFDTMRKQGFIRYLVPLNKESMFKLDTETYWN